MQSAAIFLGLGQVPALRIHLFHAIAEFAHGAEHLIIDEFHVVEIPQRVNGIAMHIGVMRESRQDSGIGSYGHRYGHRAGQPRIRALVVFGSCPLALFSATGMAVIQHDFEVIPLIAGKSSGIKPHYGNRIPFQSLGLVHGHQFHIHRRARQFGSLVFHSGKMIHPCHEST